jgi:hypothetical protein
MEAVSASPAPLRAAIAVAIADCKRYGGFGGSSSWMFSKSEMICF